MLLHKMFLRLATASLSTQWKRSYYQSRKHPTLFDNQYQWSEKIGGIFSFKNSKYKEELVLSNLAMKPFYNRHQWNKNAQVSPLIKIDLLRHQSKTLASLQHLHPAIKNTFLNVLVYVIKLIRPFSSSQLHLPVTIVDFT